MASKIPASFIKNYVAQHGSNNKFAQATAAPAAPAPTPASSPVPAPSRGRTPKPRQTKSPKSPSPKKSTAKKKPHGFFRRMLGAVAKEALRGTGHIGNHVVKSIHEDGMGGGLGGTPVNNASSGAVAGLGTSKDGSQGEPGVKRKKKNPPLMTYKLFKRTKRMT
jgi:hypothetical protein